MIQLKDKKLFEVVELCHWIPNEKSRSSPPRSKRRSRKRGNYLLNRVSSNNLSKTLVIY